MTDASGQRCGTCKWQRLQYGVYGSCGYPVPIWIRDAVLLLHRNMFPLEALSPSTLHNDDGKDCPTWHPKTT